MTSNRVAYLFHEHQVAQNLIDHHIIKVSPSLSKILNEAKFYNRLQMPFHDLPSVQKQGLKIAIRSAARSWILLTEKATIEFWKLLIFDMVKANPHLTVELAWDMKKLNPIYERLKWRADITIGLNLRDGSLPLLYVLPSEVPMVSPAIPHPHEGKIAFMMAQSTLAAIGILRHQSKESLNKIRIYGLLIAGDEVEVVVMNPIVDDSSDQERLKLDMIYESNRASWRFNLFLEPGEAQPSAPPVSASICPGRSERIFDASNETFLVPEDPDDPDEIFETSIWSFERRHTSGNINDICLAVLDRISEMLSPQIEMLKDGSLADAFSYDQDDLKTIDFTLIK